MQNLIGVDAEKAKRILDFTQSNSNSHSAWLTFMYPRLYIAKQLLKDDGVIFISIDDNEVAQLRLLMDEVFGEENFVADMIWKNKKGGGNDAKYIAIENEHILFFAKSINNVQKLFHNYSDEYLKRYKEEDDKSLFFWDTFKRKSGKQFYKIVCPDGSIIENDEYGNPISWLRSEKTFNEDLQSGEIRIVEISNQWSVQFKQRLPEGKKPRSIIENYGTTSEGSKELLELFEKNIFDNPKPTNLIKHLFDIITDENDIILDFFAGSGTTADAIMQLNADPSTGSGYGNRKFILVQLPEAIDPKKSKAAYDFVKNELKAEPTIFEITKERLLRAANKINAELDGKIEKLQSELPTEETKNEIEQLEKIKTQNTFKVFETTPIWEDYDFEAEQFDSSQTLFDAGKLSDEDIKALLTTWKTYDGIALTQELESIDLSGYTAYYGNGRLYLMNKGFKTDSLIALLEKIDSDKHFEPKSIIAFGYHMESKCLREISENVKTYNNKKKSDIDFITRY